MTTNKPGSVNQQPFYTCTGCVGSYEDCMWPADYLRVHDGECWCDSCWEERQEDLPDQSGWFDLEPYSPAPLAECEKLVEALERIVAWPDGGNQYGQENIKIFVAEALATYRNQKELSHDNH